MITKSKKRLQTDQRGIVAIIVSLFLMILISMIVLTMSQNSTREQRQSLDRQLSDQAFYNAETGINDVANYLYKHADTAASVKDDCLPLPSGAPSSSIDVNAAGVIDANGPNKYTCVQYTTAPEEIMYNGVSISTPRVVPIQPVDGAGNPVKLKDMTISWDDANDRDGSPDCGFTAGSPVLPRSCTYGGLRVELIGPQINRTAIQQGELITYLLPSPSNVGTIDINAPSYPNNQGVIDLAACTGGAGVRRCSKKLEKVNRTGVFFLSLRSLYRPVNLSISAIDDAGQPVHFKNTQYVIDSTGRAADVLRRVQVRIPVNSQFAYPGFAVQSVDSLCKYLTVTSTSSAGVTTNGVKTDDTTQCPILP